MHYILLCLDANNNPMLTMDHGIKRILDAIDLIDVHLFKLAYRDTLAPYSCGYRTINFCLKTCVFAHALACA